MTNTLRNYIPLVVCVYLCAASGLVFAQNSDDNLPQFFGVYAKLKDGTLVEIPRKSPFHYSSFERGSGNDITASLGALRKSRAYYAEKPTLILDPSDIAGFYVYGDYDVTKFFVTKFIPASQVITSNTALITDKTDGPGPREAGAYVDARKGWSLETSFRYREDKPKLYWIVPRGGAPFSKPSKSDDFFVAIELGYTDYWPIAVPEALESLRKAAEQGDADAQNELGFQYYCALDVPQDYTEAMKWFLKAAEQGHAGAQFFLGVGYSCGNGVQQDYAEAVMWYRKAAEQGDARAQCNLGGCYYAGSRGVEQDYAEAVKWYRKGADQGCANAQNCLAWLYAACKDPGMRDGEKAVKYAQMASSQHRDIPEISWGRFDTLAAAYARDGQFAKAIEAQQESLRLLKAAQGIPEEDRQEKLAAAEERLELFKNHTPYVDRKFVGQ